MMFKILGEINGSHPATADLPPDLVPIGESDSKTIEFVGNVHTVNSGARLASSYADALERLATQAAERADPAHAVRWLRALGSVAPLSGRVALRLMQALSAAGDKEAALAFAGQYTARIRTELGVEPDLSVMRLAEELRRSTSALVPAADERRTSDVVSPPAASNAASASAASARVRQPAAQLKYGLMLPVLALVIATAALMTAPWKRLHSGSPVSESSSEVRLNRIAVLPIRTVSNDSVDVHFASAIHDELMRAFLKVRALRVTPRYSVMRFESASDDVKAIANELRVRYMLLGTLERNTGKLRVELELWDAQAQRAIWSHTYPWDPASILSTPQAVAEEVASQLQTELTAAERAALAATPTKSLNAYEHFLRGNEYARSENWSRDWGPAIEEYQQAVAADPNFALAYAALGVQHLRFIWWNRDRSPERLVRAKEAIATAARLQPDAPEVHIAWGYYYFWGHRDHARALEWLQRARKERPSDADAIFALAEVNRRLGKYETAIKDFQYAWELDPR